MFQSIQGLLQFAHMGLHVMCLESQWLFHVHFILDYTIQEICLDIHLMYFPFHNYWQSKYGANASVPVLMQKTTSKFVPNLTSTVLKMCLQSASFSVLVRSAMMVVRSNECYRIFLGIMPSICLDDQSHKTKIFFKI